jgi:hypothetical protein
MDENGAEDEFLFHTKRRKKTKKQRLIINAE